MTALRKDVLSEEFRNELARLVRAGFPLLPLGGGADGKAPLQKAWAGSKLSLGQVLGPLFRSGSHVYGVRLDSLAVIDCDDDSPELVAAMEARFGPSPVHVKTPRGRHLYYRAGGPVPNLRGEGLPVDIKTGGRAYVVGPHSIRADGGTYRPEGGVLGVDALPVLRPPHGPLRAAGTVPVGHRHPMLLKEAVAMVEFVDSADELAANLAGVRDDLCADTDTMPDSELQAIAEWAWKLRLGNRVFKGRDSAFHIDRRALDVLRAYDNQSDATAFYVLLVDLHGHRPGKRFALDAQSDASGQRFR